MRENFSKAFDLLMELEGYESSDKYGGYTKYGLASLANPDIDYKRLTAAKAKDIYLERYWKPLKCDELQYPLDVVMFIQGVNIGVGRAVAYMGKSNGLYDFVMMNLRHYATREKELRDKYLAGWVNRLIKVWEAL
jgi:lysozyme family protein